MRLLSSYAQRLERAFQEEEYGRERDTFVRKLSAQNLALGAKLLYDAVDALWYAAGDSAGAQGHRDRAGVSAAIAALPGADDGALSPQGQGMKTLQHFAA